MNDTKIQWHPGFVAAMNLEFLQNKGDLVFLKEHNLNTKPLEIDLLVIKKDASAKISNEIGWMFRGHNIFEYKSPDDHLDVDVFYKVLGYACLYKSYGEVLDARKAGDITVSLVRDVRPEGLFRYLREHGHLVSHKGNGIYYIEGNVPFPVQVIATKELDKDAHVWLRALSKNIQKEDALRLLHIAPGLDGAFEREMADSVLAVMLEANRTFVDQLKGENDMYEESLFKLLEPRLPAILERDDSRYKALYQILEPKLPVLLEDAIKNGDDSKYEALYQILEPKLALARDRDVKRTLEEVRKETRHEDILGAVGALREFGHSDQEIKDAIMRNYHLTSGEANEFLQKPSIAHN